MQIPRKNLWLIFLSILRNDASFEAAESTIIQIDDADSIAFDTQLRAKKAVRQLHLPKN